MAEEHSQRIQTSLLNGVEKKALVWLADRQPRWVTSDILTLAGTLGAVIIAAGYILSNYNIQFLWLASFGFIVNWYGDSLDGTLARVRNQQRPVYGFYLDHTVDAVNEVLMFVGAGLSPFINFSLALGLLVVYLMLSLNVSMNAHLKNEFKLTYAKLGPTEFRLIVIIFNTILLCVPAWATRVKTCIWFGHEWSVHALDYAGFAILVILIVIYIVTIIHDARDYARKDPMPQK